MGSLKVEIVRFTLVAARGQYVAKTIGFTEYPVSTGERRRDEPWRECLDWLQFLANQNERPAGTKWDVRETRRVIDASDVERWLRTR